MGAQLKETAPGNSLRKQLKGQLSLGGKLRGTAWGIERKWAWEKGIYRSFIGLTFGVLDRDLMEVVRFDDIPTSNKCISILA